MSWEERIEQDLVIVTGDGKTYTPKYQVASKAMEFNNSVYRFPGMPGGLVDRKEISERQFPMLLIFDGADHLDKADAFEKSSMDKRPWQVSHPYYGEILAHPVSMTFENEDLNTTVVNVTIIETIKVAEVLKTTVSPKDKITSDAEAARMTDIASISSDLPAVNVKDRGASIKTAANQFKAVSSRIRESSDLSKYQQIYNKYVAVLNNASSATLDIAQAMHNYSTAPYLLIDTIDSRLNMFKLQYKILRRNLDTLFSRTSKRLYETQSGSILLGMALTVVTNVGDSFRLISGVLPVINLLRETYQDWVLSLDVISSPNGGVEDSYIPNGDSIQSIAGVMSYTISSLLTIALGSMQERTIRTTEDTNAVLLTSKYYGLDKNDENLSFFLETNKIGISEILRIKKDRLIKYYV